MARWKVKPSVKGTGGTLHGEIIYDDSGSIQQFTQDVNPFLEQAKQDREMGDGHSHYRKMYSVPDVIAIEIKNKWGLDIFDPAFMHDSEKKAKLNLIIQQEYPKLLSTNKSII